MALKYTKIPENTFEQLQLNAGILLSEFDPKTGEVKEEAKLGATSGGINFTDVPEYVDFGEDLDNCPKNTKELKKITGREIKISGTFKTCSTARAKALIAAADIDKTDATKIVPRDVLKDEDFQDIWFVCDYGAKDGGFIAIHLMNALNTAGFSLQSTDKEKGEFAFEYTAHYSMNAQDTVPYEMYVKAGA